MIRLTLTGAFTGGGTGFIGSNLREVLLRENYKVTVVSRARTGEEHIVTWVIALFKLSIINYLQVFYLKE